MQILFVHGAGGWVDDQPIIAGLRRRCGLSVTAERYPDDDMSAVAWRGRLARQLRATGPTTILVGHSFGASIALLHAADGSPDVLPAGLVLLAMPDWSPEGWDVPEYAVPAGARPPTGLPIRLHHCRDDDVVPVEHLDLHLRHAPQAHARRHVTGGHQLDGRIAAVADDVMTLATQREE